MSPLINSILGLIFLLLAFTATFLMYHLWGYPFDHEKLKSAAPPRLMRLHRVLGHAYFLVYLVLMSQMLPRLWRYQVEFPARTVAHLMLGMAIGVILIVKIAIVRWFKHMEGTLAPFLGTTLLVFTVLMLGLSLPFSLRAIILERNALGGSAFSSENLARVRSLLDRAGLPPEAKLDDLASAGGVRRGQIVLASRCVQCHDLRTILARPRTPEDWGQTVRRMGDRSALVAPIADADQWAVVSYLVAISPTLQQELVAKRTQQMSQDTARHAADELANAPSTAPSPPLAGFDLAAAKKTFEMTCVQCHALTEVQHSPPASEKESRDLVARMVGNGLKADDGELRQIVGYLSATYVNR